MQPYIGLYDGNERQASTKCLEASLYESFRSLKVEGAHTFTQISRNSLKRYAVNYILPLLLRDVNVKIINYFTRL